MVAVRRNTTAVVSVATNQQAARAAADDQGSAPESLLSHTLYSSSGLDLTHH
jgi:hypothetical protein